MKILCGSKFYEEKNYIISFILNEFLGIDAEIHFSETLSSEYEIKYDKKSLKISDVFFNQNKNGWLSPSWLPQLPIREFKSSEYGLQKCSLHSQIPIIYPSSDSSSILITKSNITYLNLDIFGTAFFFLSRYEEFVAKEYDEHGRFSYHNSIAAMYSIVNRPIVNEYIEIFWNVLNSIWPNLKRKVNQFKICLTHDIDRPVFHKNTKKVDYNHYNKMLGLSEKYETQSIYYFLTARTSKYDADYTLEDQEIQNLMKKVFEAGHKVGLHPSYSSIRSKFIIKREFEILRKTCERLSIFQESWESRQHYLRYYPQSTMNHIEFAGISFDSTLGFAEKIGFRCGFCHDFPVFDLLNRRQLKLRERPLMIMDDTLTSPKYMNLSLEDSSSQDQCLSIKHACKYFNGTFTILFHDNYLREQNHFTFLDKLLSEEPM